MVRESPKFSFPGDLCFFTLGWCNIVQSMIHGVVNDLSIIYKFSYYFFDVFNLDADSGGARSSLTNCTLALYSSLWIADGT